MKLASLDDGTRDGALVAVSHDLRLAVRADTVASTLQEALDDWPGAAPELAELCRRLNAGTMPGAFEFHHDSDAAAIAAPLPRAYQWLDASAYLSHVALARRLRGAEMPPHADTDPLMYQGCSAPFLAPRAPIRAISEAWGIDFEAEIAIVTDDVPVGVEARAAAAHIALVALVNDVSFRNLIPGELAKGFGFVHGKPPSAMAPVMVGLDGLGTAWRDGRLHLPVECRVNGEMIGRPDAGADMAFGFPELIAHAAKTRPLAAGTVIGAGTVSNVDPAAGAACLVELRMREQLETGAPATAYLNFGDRVRLEALGADGASLFGAIDQQIEPVES